MNRSDGGSHSSDELLSGIRHTRSQMDRTIDELGERLQPRHLLDDMIDHFWKREEQTARGTREAATRLGHNMAGHIREHPLPSLLIGAGIIWLLAEQSERVQRAESRLVQRAREKTGQTAGAIGERAGELSQSLQEEGAQMGADAKERAGAAWESTKSKSRDLQHEMASRLRHSGEALRDTAENHPLAIGLGCLALGAIAGAMAPRTRAENEMMGPAADCLREEAMKQAQELVSEGKQVAERAIEAGREEAHQQRLDPERIRQRAEETAKPGEPPAGLD